MIISSHNAYNNVNFCRNILEKIPDKPKIPIQNYLLDLICDEDGKEKSIYLNDASYLIKEIWDEIIKNNWRELNVRKFIPDKLNITTSIFYGYKNGRKKIFSTCEECEFNDGCFFGKFPDQAAAVPVGNPSDSKKSPRQDGECRHKSPRQAGLGMQQRQHPEINGPPKNDGTPDAKR